MSNLTSQMSRRRLLMGGAAVPLVLGANGCGYLLYPGRNGRRGGYIDIPVLIVDLLWLIPGLVPGAICLLVDFSSGCIYMEGGRRVRASEPPESPQHATRVAVHVDGKVVAEGEVQPDGKASLTWSHQMDETTLRAKGRLLLQRSDGAAAEARVGDLI